MDIKNIKQTIMYLGYPEYYAKVLICLVSAEKYLDAQEIEQHTGVPLGRLYSILLDLENEKLIVRVAGKPQKYYANQSEKIIESITKKKKHELEQTKQMTSELLKKLSFGLKNIKTQISDVDIMVLNSDKEYWEEYNKSVSKLKKGDMYRIINSVRLADSFLPDELEKNKEIKKMIIQYEKKLQEGVTIHHAVNPETLVQNTYRELGNSKEKLLLSMKTLLNSYKRFSKYNHYISITKHFENIVVVIIRNDIYFEFYDYVTTSIKTAIRIRSTKLASDLVKWFDNISTGNLNSSKDYLRFEKEIEKQLKKILAKNP